MLKRRLALVPFLVCLAVRVSAGTAEHGQSPEWRASVEGLTFVAVEKKFHATGRPSCLDCALAGSQALEDLPAAVLERSGPRAVEYEGFLTTWLPEPAARALAEVARGHGLAVGLGIEQEVRLPWHDLMPGNPVQRDDPRVTQKVPPAVVPGLYLVQFAYPIRQEWLDELAACGAERIAYFQHRTFLVRALGPATLTRCAVERYLSWIEPFRASDRVSADLLEAPSERGYWLQFIPGTDLKAKALALPGTAEAEGSYESAEDRVSYLRVQASLEDLRQIVATDPDLLSVAAQGEAGPSDERQAQIIAGQHNGVSLCTVGTVSCPHYRQWLNGRGLLSAQNQQVVAVIDVGYDDGLAPSPAIDHHPDLESPERLDDLSAIGGTDRADRAGHGTMVAGIIAGDGSVANSTLAADAQGFYYGSGIAPGAKIYAFDMLNFFQDPYLFETALNYSRVRSGGGDRAFIANNSWNENETRNPGGTYIPQPDYTVLAQLFDHRVLDASEYSDHAPASPALPGDQPMTMVFSAGNFAWDCENSRSDWDSVSSPASAKNVIAVGATESYRPSPAPPMACGGCYANGTPNGRPPDVDATHIGRVATFSGRGMFFGPYPAQKLAHTTRIKPDLVAPAVRVFSTVPYSYASYDSATTVTGCSKYYFAPNPSNTYHSYGTGTSFAAPVVSGAAALKRKWFLDRGINPAPSLLKAALISTADSLGGLGLAGHDHRPSPLSGWGRVNLNRLTDSRSRRYVNASAQNAVATGEALTYSFKAADLAAPVFIVLVWDDEPADVLTHSQAPLKNDLALDVAGGTWRGNFFAENMTGADTGYSYQFTIGVWANDSINTVEAVFLPPGALSAGQVLQVRVTGINVPQGRSNGRQPFSIYAYNVTTP